MSQFDKIVEVNISRETSGVSEKAFGVLLVLGGSKAFTSSTAGRWRVREYSSIDSVLVDFADTTAEYKGTLAYFSQNPQPSKVMIGQLWTGETMSQAISACITANAGWYALVLTDRTVLNVVAAGAAIEAGGERVFLTATDDTDAIETAETNPLAGLAAYDRSIVLFHTASATTYPEAALFGAIATMQPGEYTLNLQKLAGVIADTITDTQATTATTRKITYYVTIGALYRTQGGKMQGGEWFDVIVFVDWLKARMQERTFSALASGKRKVPYTNAGIAILENAVRSVLEDGIDAKGLSPESYDADGVQTGGYTITVKDVADLPFNDKAARKVDAISFIGWLAGAIHSTKIVGTVTY